MAALKVLIVDETGDGRVVLEALTEAGCDGVCLALAGLDVNAIIETTTPDAVVFCLCQPTQALLEMIAELNEKHPLPVILFAEAQEDDVTDRVIEAGVSAYVVDGLDIKRIKSIIDIALARFRERQALTRALAETRAQLAERKLIERAKGLLMKTQGLDEDGAYSLLRKLAMDSHRPLAEVAKALLAQAGKVR